MDTVNTDKSIGSNQWLLDLFVNDTGTYTPYVPKPAPIPCPRCNGSGRISYYSHIKAGECFKCNGRGFKINVLA